MEKAKFFLKGTYFKKSLLLLVLLLNISIVNASTIDFEGLSYGPFIDGEPVIAGEFVFTPATLHSHYLNIPFPSSNGTYYFAIDDAGGNSPLNIRKQNNSAFSFLSIDLAEFYSEPFSLVSFTGYNGINPVISQAVAMDMLYDGNGGIPDFQTFIFGSEWSNLTSLVIDSSGPQGHHNGISLDNFVYRNPTPQVPEPGTMFLLGSLASGLFGFAGLKKRFTK